MMGWADLDAELQAWQDAGRVPEFWWRDDDLVRPTAALDRLLGLAQRHDCPLHLAVIPAHVADDLASALNPVRQAFVLQHGLSHTNHEPKGCGASEVGMHRSLADIRADLRAGWAHLSRAGLPRLLPAFAAPWNRISEAAVAELSAQGYRIVSASHARAAARPAAGIEQVNIHMDPIRWKQGPRFRGTTRCLDLVVTHLRQKRLGEADAGEPTGVLTHHLDMDVDTWAFTVDLFARLCAPGAGRWVALAERLDA
jgi:hypothetical protein